MSNRLLQKIFTAYKSELDRSPQPLKNIKAIDAITRCRTKEMGVSHYSCSNRHEGIDQFHSCRNRSCFLCAQKKRQQWIESQKARVLNTAHFHVIFTLPHEYLGLWRYNEKLMTALIFKASQRTLLDLLSDSKHGGITPGILMALHTWGRSLTLHPHTHCLVSAGGLNSKGEWKDLSEYLLPSSVIRQVYRGKIQALIKEAFQSQELILPPDMSTSDFWGIYRSLYQKNWSVRIEERYEHGKGVLVYLARYCKGGPLNPDQIQSCDSTGISMRYLDHRVKRTKTMRLNPKAFIRRILEHVPPIGVHTVRYYGLYSPAAKAKHKKCVLIKGTIASIKPSTDSQIRSMLLTCRTCGEPLKLAYNQIVQARKGISLYKRGVGIVPGSMFNKSMKHDIANVPLSGVT